jgi:hypothetical protein
MSGQSAITLASHINTLPSEGKRALALGLGLAPRGRQTDFMRGHYRSKIDWWLAVALILGPLASASALYNLVSQGKSNAFIIAVVFAPGVVLPLWILFGTFYRITDGSLIVKCGPCKWTVPLKQIRLIEGTREIWSSPALSLDRLRIHYGVSETIVISPQARAEFLADIKEVTGI